MKKDTGLYIAFIVVVVAGLAVIMGNGSNNTNTGQTTEVYSYADDMGTTVYGYAALAAMRPTCTKNGGYDIYTKGTASYNVGRGTQTRTDYCRELQSNELVELNCSGNRLVFTNVKCKFGCVDGACRTSEPPAVCGDKYKSSTEQCDGKYLGDASCISLGFDYGKLSCNPFGTPNQCLFNTSDCKKALCGNKIKEPSEACEGKQVTSCLSLDKKTYKSGTATCNNCQWDKSQCVLRSTCGDGIIGLGEDCEGEGLTTLCSLIDTTYTTGNAVCVKCHYNFSKCFTDTKNMSVSLTVSSDPQNASVMVSAIVPPGMGMPAYVHEGLTPIAFTDLGANNYSITITKEGYYDYSTVKALQPGETVVKVALTKQNSHADSDGGINYYVKGWVPHVSGYSENNDTCSSDDNMTSYQGARLLEFYEVDSSTWGNIFYNCPNGCIDGACIPSKSQYVVLTPAEIPNGFKLTDLTTSPDYQSWMKNPGYYPLEYLPELIKPNGLKNVDSIYAAVYSTDNVGYKKIAIISYKFISNNDLDSQLLIIYNNIINQGSERFRLIRSGNLLVEVSNGAELPATTFGEITNSIATRINGTILKPVSGECAINNGICRYSCYDPSEKSLGSLDCTGGTSINCCVPNIAKCGDNVKNGNEQCDGADLGTASCAMLASAYTGGVLTCDSSCKLNFSSCVIAPTSTDTLSIYPEFLLDSNKKYAGQIVVGTLAPTYDVVAALDIAHYIAQHFAPATNNTPQVVGMAVLDDAASHTKPSISIDMPCSNRFSEYLLNYPYNCTTGYEPNIGRIDLITKNGQKVIIVGGFSETEMKAASRVLANWNDYEAGFGSATSLCVDTTNGINPLKVYKCSPLVVESKPICGDNITEAAEQCDGTDLHGMTCANFANFKTGALHCYPKGSPNECMWDTSDCVVGIQCPIPDCAAPPVGCIYINPHHDSNNCQTDCGTLSCSLNCPIPQCVAPPENCTYVNPQYDSNNCRINCGTLSCS